MFAIIAAVLFAVVLVLDLANKDLGPMLTDRLPDHRRLPLHRPAPGRRREPDSRLPRPSPGPG